MKTLFRNILCGLLLTSVFMSYASHANILVISHANVVAQNLNKKDIRNIFLNKTNKLSTKKSPELVLFDLTSPSISPFFKEVMRMTPSKYKSYWARQIFTGKGKAPKYMDNQQAIIDYVAMTPYSIGLIDIHDTDMAIGAQKIYLDGVRTLFTLKK